MAVRREVEFPAAGRYTLWVRYADYRNKEEAFGIRVRQNGKETHHVFGLKPVVDELDPMKLLWEWAYGWDSAPFEIEKGRAEVELYTTGPTGARRSLDSLCFTTDAAYRPFGREKPDCAAWVPLREMQKGLPATVEPLAARKLPRDLPKEWKIASEPPAFLWNVGAAWQNELKKPPAERINAPFGVDPPLEKEFLTTFRGKPIPIFDDPLSGPVWHIPLYPATFANGSPYLDWLTAHPKQKFSLLLNYGDPVWPKETTDADRRAVHANLLRFQKQFVGFVAGENLSYANVSQAELEKRVRAAKSRSEVLQALRELNSAGTIQKFHDYYGKDVTEAEAWEPVISCLSATNEAFVHAICDWGAKQIGHENTGNSPTLARRLAFLRGACRQFGAKLVDYQSCNLGDSATMFSREQYFYPASSRYIFDNSYDAWAGAGTHWLLRDYLLWHLAGVSAFYNEQGIDLFWKPGGGSAGDGFPVQLSPKGKVAEFAQKLAGKHPRGTQVTPIAFLLDEAHGYTQERFSAGAFGLNPAWNPAVLTPGRHEEAIRGWFDVAYFPAPETQGEPASAIRQTYVNGVFGDMFDVIVNAPKHTEIAQTYPVLIAAGEVSVSEEWGRALRDYVRRGGTLVVSAEQLSGPGVKELGLPAFGASREASSLTWKLTGETLPSNLFRYHALAAGRDTVLAETPDGTPLALSQKQGAGRLIVLGVPLGLGIDGSPVPLLSVLLRHLAAGLMPVKVQGDVEWTCNRLDDGSWLVALFNNRGVIKPEHGVLPTDQREQVRVTLTVPFAVKNSAEWITESPQTWQPDGKGSLLTLTIPAGATRFLLLTP